jgi:hypothetical protein
MLNAIFVHNINVIANIKDSVLRDDTMSGMAGRSMPVPTPVAGGQW